MKILIFSDSHCGYASGEERGEDSFLALEEAMKAGNDADLILVAGDIFDSRIAKQETFARAARLFGLAQGMPSATRLVDVVGKDRKEVSPLALRGIPVVAIHGTHERRSRHMVNPVQELEHAGLLLYLHCATLVFEVGGRKVAVHGMSGVPERYAKDCLLQWKPEPVPGALNILMLHQSIDPYVYSPRDPPSLKLEDLPDGFDLYVLGHLHWHESKPFKAGTLVLPGSLIPTSLHKQEADQQKGYYVYDAGLDFRPLSSQRKVFFREFQAGQDLESKVIEGLEEIAATEPDRKPLVLVKVGGELAKGSLPPDFSGIEKRFRDRLMLRFSKDFTAEDFEKNVELLRAMREQRLSPEEMGLRILEDNLEQAGCKVRIHEIFDLLADSSADVLFKELSGGEA